MNVSLVTVATDMNDCVDRYVSSCKSYGFDPHILGLNREWRGGNMAVGIGGGQKVNLLREFLKDKSDNDIFIFTDSYDVIANDSVESIIKTYMLYFKDAVVFGAESACWPDGSLASSYPSSSSKFKYLNSGNFIGPCSKLRELLTVEINDHDDDQLYYTRRLLESLKSSGNGKRRIELDYDQRLFMCLNECPCEVDPECVCVRTTNYVRPAFVHGNGPPSVKHRLNSLSNYVLPRNPVDFDRNLPSVTVVFEELNTPTKECIDGLLDVTGVVEVLYIGDTPDPRISEKWTCKCFKNDSLPQILSNAQGEYILYVSSHAVLEEPDVVRILLSDDHVCSAKSPLLRSSHASNFRDEGSHETDIDILNMRRVGFFNVPYIWHVVLVARDVMLQSLQHHKKGALDDAFCAGMLRINRFLFVCNTRNFGYLHDLVTDPNLK